MPKAVKIILVVVAAIIVFAGAFVVRQIHITLTGDHKPGTKTQTVIQSTQEMIRILAHPETGFPGQHKTTILCMGIDDTWTNSDEVYTSHSRTDTMFLVTLDLDNKTATMLS